MEKNRTEKGENDIQHSGRGSYWATRIVLLRFLASIYTVAFLIALHQNKQLLGNRGLLPARLYLKEAKESIRSFTPLSRFLKAPTLFWFLESDWNSLDWYLDVFAYCGLGISFVVLVTGAANMIALSALWLLYHSIVNVGQRWYSFGWESQLLENGFLAIWLCPLFAWKKYPKNTKTSVVVIYAFRWLIFRVMFGSGMIKLRGDKCWKDLTCMDYHYESQPLPNPNAYFMHNLPHWFHVIEVLINHFVEVVGPFLVLVPFRPLVLFGGVVQILFQLLIIFSGNYSILNWVCILPCFACFDDSFFLRFYSQDSSLKVQTLNSVQHVPFGAKFRRIVNVLLAVFIGYLSIPVVQNLLSSKQVMNTSFDPFRIVGTYGAFGSITKERFEIIMQGTYDNPYSEDAVWEEYEFKCKPGNISRAPCYINPYHYRLDWLMWFASLENFQRNPWLFHLVAKMLLNDEFVSELLAHNPFLGINPPGHIRLELYRYKFTKFGEKNWWSRKRVKPYLEPIDYENAKRILKQFQWID